VLVVLVVPSRQALHHQHQPISSTFAESPEMNCTLLHAVLVG